MGERTLMLIYTLGWIECSKFPILRKDAIILMDQILLSTHQLVMTNEERQTINDLSDEVSFTMLQMGFNSKQSKNIARSTFKKTDIIDKRH